MDKLLISDSARIIDSSLCSDVKVYRDVSITRSSVGSECIIADNTDVYDSKLANCVRLGRRNFVLGSTFGFGSYTGSNTEIRNVQIGKMCNISWDVSLGGHNHNYKAASMTSAVPWNTVFHTKREESHHPEECIIGNDVWIASGANIIEGVTVGDGCVVGAGAVVTNNLPPYSIAAGVPARVIKKRFDDNSISRLLGLRWWDWPREDIAQASDLLLRDMDEETLLLLEQIGRNVRALYGSFE